MGIHSVGVPLIQVSQEAVDLPSEQLLSGLVSSVELENSALQGTQSGPGPETIVLRNGGIGLSPTVATNPPLSLWGQF